MKNRANSFLIYPGKQLHIGPRDVLPVPWNPLLTQLWHRAIGLLSGHTRDIFLKPTPRVGMDWTALGNAKLICGLRTTLHLVPFQNPSCVMLFFTPCLPTAGHQVCFKRHHPEANLRKRTQHTLLSLSLMDCCLQGHSFNNHRVNIQSLNLGSALSTFCY